MRIVFADTFYYLAWINPRDNAHRAARQFSADFRGTIVTTSVILFELGDALCRAANRPNFLTLFDGIRQDSNTILVPIDEGYQDRGIELFRNRPDKDWSLTDCVSFVVMTELELTDALTGDRHFEQAGFRILLGQEAGA
jgi:uncharacterized protein